MKIYPESNLAKDLYQMFVESNGVSHPVQTAWDKCQETYGEIEVGSPIDELFRQTINFTVSNVEHIILDHKNYAE